MLPLTAGKCRRSYLPSVQGKLSNYQGRSMRQRVGTHTTTRALRCQRCHKLGLASAITISPGLVERRLRDGRYRDHAGASCSNDHHWWSIHPEALRLARQANILAQLSLPIQHEKESSF